MSGRDAQALVFAYGIDMDNPGQSTGSRRLDFAEALHRTDPLRSGQLRDERTVRGYEDAAIHELLDHLLLPDKPLRIEVVYGPELPFGPWDYVVDVRWGTDMLRDVEDEQWQPVPLRHPTFFFYTIPSHFHRVINLSVEVKFGYQKPRFAFRTEGRTGWDLMFPADRNELKITRAVGWDDPSVDWSWIARFELEDPDRTKSHGMIWDWEAEPEVGA